MTHFVRTVTMLWDRLDCSFMSVVEVARFLLASSATKMLVNATLPV